MRVIFEMLTKAELSRYRGKREKLEETQKRLELIKMTVGLNGAGLMGGPIKGGHSDSVSRYAARIADLYAKVDELKKELKGTALEVKAIPDRTARQAIWIKYIAEGRRHSWESIARHLGISRQGLHKKINRYVK